MLGLVGFDLHPGSFRANAVAFAAGQSGGRRLHAIQRAESGSICF